MTVRKAAIATLLILAAAAAIELWMGRTPICTCRSVELWVGARDSPTTSQMLLDWYSFSHLIHGFLFYVALWLVGRRWPIESRFLIALSVETGWEIFENTAYVIARYRATAAAQGYSGDSVINSLTDILLMCAGFMISRKLPVWVSVLVVLVLELVPLFVIRDNLTLNIWMFLWPNSAVEAWQARG